MRLSRTCVFVLGLAVALTGLASPVSAQTRALEKRLVPHYASSGPLGNADSAPAVVWATVVEADAPWLQVTFRRAVLGSGSQIRLTSLLDGATQHLGSVQLDQWQNVSAYFNGGAVRVELIAGPGTSGQIVEIGDLWAGLVPVEPYTQCGPTDDREPSNFPERGRILSVGCTGWMFNERSCFASAGHCVASGGLSVVQFNVPLSNSNGSLNHPGPEDQYAVDTSTKVFTNGGVGNDWGLFEVFPNTETGLLPYEKQGAFLELAGSLPAVDETISVVGYGVDFNNREFNQVQQYSDGPVTSATSTTLRYQADTEGGNSGSGVVYEATGEAVAIHTHGGCNVGLTGSNAGTSITHPALQSALASFCQPSTLEISVSGTCPGPVTVTVSGAPANSEVGIVSAGNNNGFIKGGAQCNGTRFQIGEPFKLPPTFVIVDGSGGGATGVTLDSDKCWVEAIALAGCDTSGATLVP